MSGMFARFWHGGRLGVAVLLAAMLLAGVSVAVAADGPPAGPVSPAFGPTTGGTVVTISGTGFTGATAVSFGDLAATAFTVTSDTQISATTPAHAAGAVPVSVTKAGGTTAIVGGFFFITGATGTTPTIASVNPTQGSTAGHTPVVITGGGFQSGARVTFGGVQATEAHVLADAIIIAITPAHAAGPVDVVVTNTSGQSGTLAGGFTYVTPAPAPAPTITAIDPATGPAGTLARDSTAIDDHSGLVVAIMGTGFLPHAAVTFGGVPVDHATVLSDRVILTTPPAHAAGPVDVVVTNPDNQSATAHNGFTYVAPTPGVPPTIATINPNTGPATGTTTGTSNRDQPHTVVTITGTGFQRDATVTFGGVAARDVVVLSDSTLLALAPPHAAGAVDVVVTNPDTQSATAPGGFTYVVPAPGAAPTVTKVDPPSGSTGDHMRFVTITGTGFQDGASVTFGTTRAEHVETLSGTVIVTTAPDHAPGTVDVTVTNPDNQSGTLANAYTYRAPLQVTSVTPNTGPSAGGTDVTIAGSGFLTGARVFFDGLPATVTAVSGDGLSISAKTPAHPAGVATLIVSNPNGQRGVLSRAFTFTGNTTPPTTAPLTISQIEPAAGPAAGGVWVAVHGAGFTDGLTVTFDTTPGTGVHIINSTLLVVTTPAHAAGAVDVTVSDASGHHSTLPGGYSYIATPSQRPSGSTGDPHGPPPTALPPAGRGPVKPPGIASAGGGAPTAPHPLPPGR